MSLTDFDFVTLIVVPKRPLYMLHTDEPSASADDVFKRRDLQMSVHPT